MELQIRNNFEALLSIQDQWRALVLGTPGQPFFMLPEYQTSWWQHLGHGTLEILEFYDAGQLVGIAPLYSDVVLVAGKQQKIYRLVGAVDESDYLDIILKPEQAPNVYQKLIEYLSNNTWEAVWLESLPATSVTPTFLTSVAIQKGWAAKTSQQTVSPVITLSATFDSYLQTLETKQQKNFKRLMAKLEEEDDISYRLITNAADMPQAMASFISLHKASGTDKASFWHSSREAFFSKAVTQLAFQGLVKLYFLDVNGQAAATLLIFDWQNQFLLYNSGFDAYTYGHLGVSNALMLHTIEAAIKLGRSRYDFMRGDEAYKFNFQPKSEPVWDLHLTR